MNKGKTSFRISPDLSSYGSFRNYLKLVFREGKGENSLVLWECPSGAEALSGATYRYQQASGVEESNPTNVADLSWSQAGRKDLIGHGLWQEIF